MLLRNRFELTRLPVGAGQKPKEKQNENRKKDTVVPSSALSVCIPVRNEELVIESLLESLRQQTSMPLEILVLDDQSEDRTPELLRKEKERFEGGIEREIEEELEGERVDGRRTKGERVDGRRTKGERVDGSHQPLILLEGEPKPPGWLGKPWACHQLAKHAQGDLLLFLDADTLAEPTLLERIETVFQRQDLSMITIWPHQILGSFWEKTVIPLMYYALVTLLPSIYVYRSPRWMPPPFRRTFRSAFAAACGQCIAFRRDAYDAIGGHESVRMEVVEDVGLAKRALARGLRLRMFEGVTSLRCRMYRSPQEMFQGFRKNFLAGFGNHLPLFLFAAFIHIAVFLMPFLILPYAFFSHQPLLILLSAGAIGLLLAHRLLLASWFQWNPVYGLLHPLGVLWFQRLGLTKVLDHLLRREHHWKGRSV